MITTMALKEKCAGGVYGLRYADDSNLCKIKTT
jgi:hypothetical protein